MESEKQLLDDILSGSRDAMHRLYDRYIGYVMAVGLRYVPDRDEVRDVVQDSFVKIFSSISRFEYRGEGSLKGWMLRIVANEAISYAKAKTKFVFTDEVPDEPEADSPEVERVPPDVLTRLIGPLSRGKGLGRGGQGKGFAAGSHEVEDTCREDALVLRLQEHLR